MGKSKRNSPKPGGNRAQRLAERRAALEQAAQAVTRPFEGLAAECDLVALREFVPSATATLKLSPGAAAERSVVLATVLPGAVAALVRAGDEPTGYVGVQVQAEGDNPAADLAAAILWTQSAEPGESLPAASSVEGGPTLADVIDPGAALELTVHQDFDWWVPEGVEPDPQVAATIEQAKQAIMPSDRLDLGADAVGAAWWVDAGEKAHLRWVRPEPEDDLMLALARLHASGGLHLGEGSRFAGSFRTHGLLVPVFDLDPERHAAEWATPAVEFGARLAEALASDAPMSAEERRSRDGLRSRQVTLR
ncbi:hypothetical protein IU485_24460 [Nocardia cyriacigeorgica]|uniref:DUF5926 domain-containing protein n=1 Tax=Nocardia cyriacigeorgica (strain GUH-2) TaxID=1127134 RepID=H6R6E1_NOCCG|nr:DUF5926 family protein [Nocardia cyriacigeorgica]MBF6084533.1 hypothetical protein [Nocardia cyriacigeorgica]MBF6286658.1 hypothetical protein [Nocardia cyriacigeorgica]CCF60914.1 conserved protein of unknown function [Nocardia cyriacigeorgica GUH-2]BDT84330.1 hypothetical protein FMUAM8_00940 [Nocardia cyriacigeorgica]BDU03829.1 hypothetical protein FMUBM48_00920 [Nocardia cyriacigeorgica]